jgi:hypothetical protein
MWYTCTSEYTHDVYHLQARCLAGGLGGSMGMLLGVAGAPTNNMVLAGWSAILWTGAGVAGGSMSAQVLALNPE